MARVQPAAGASLGTVLAPPELEALKIRFVADRLAETCPAYAIAAAGIWAKVSPRLS